MGFPDGSAGKESTCNGGNTADVDVIPGSRISPQKGNDNRLQYACLKNPMDKGAWQAIGQRVAKNGTWLSTHH